MGSAINIPNLLTMLRILLVPLMILQLVREAFVSALCLFALAAVTDGLDGFTARRFNLCTRLGALLDPLADKLLITASAVTLSVAGRFPWWLAVAIIVREIVILAGAAAYFRRKKDLEIAPSLPGKANTLVLLAVILLLLGQLAGLIDIGTWLPLVFAIAFGSVLVSGVHYVLVWGRKASVPDCSSL